MVTCSRGSGDVFDRCRPVIKYRRNHRKPQTGVKPQVTVYLMHQSMYSTARDPTPGNSGGTYFERDHFHLHSTTSRGTIFNKLHCPHEEHLQTITLPPWDFFFCNFHCYCTSPVLVWGNILVNSTTFPHIAAWWGTVFLHVSPAQCIVRMSKSHCTSTDPPPPPRSIVVRASAWGVEGRSSISDRITPKT